MKKLLAILLLVSIVLSFGVCAYAEPPAAGDYDDQYIDLTGEWNFKVYRKYNNMYQYFWYDACEVSWEDAETALLPSADEYSQWEALTCPAADYSTGGLLQMYRGDTSVTTERTELAAEDLFPNWSEAWFCKTIEVPAGFVQGETVTLMLGVIDDVDVVYINGTPVAQSGFVTGEGVKSDPADCPADGGFINHGAFSFEKSYWEVTREYEIPASVLVEGANEICIRIYNNNSFGGFYDRTMAIVSTKEALNYLKNLPIEVLEDSAACEAVIAAQTAAIEAEDINAYAATLSEDYNENELNKDEQVAAMQLIFDTYDNLKVTDEGTGYYIYKDTPVYYAASRVITGTTAEGEAIVSSKTDLIVYLDDSAEGSLVYGNHSFCYSVTYTSHIEEMGGKTLKYSIYLPASYYENTEKSYPVVYLLHGINSTGDSFVNVDHIEDHMNDWIASGDITEMIVVMPNSGKSSFYADTDYADGITDSAGPWAKHIWADIVEEIDSNYRTLPSAEFRGISGISMGGAGVVTVGMTHTDIFSSFATHMGAVPENFSDYMTAEGDALAALSFYMDCGYQDQMVDYTRTEAAAQYLESIGADITWELRDGAHNSAFYMTGMPNSMAVHSAHFVANGCEG